MATETTDLDEQALVLRSQSRGFRSIAEALGLGRPTEANEAFNRALRRRPPDEQAAIRAEENSRLDRLADAVRHDSARSAEEVEKRLQAIERLRTRLMSD